MKRATVAWAMTAVIALVFVVATVPPRNAAAQGPIVLPSTPSPTPRVTPSPPSPTASPPAGVPDKPAPVAPAAPKPAAAPAPAAPAPASTIQPAAPRPVVAPAANIPAALPRTGAGLAADTAASPVWALIGGAGALSMLGATAIAARRGRRPTTPG